MQVTDNLHKICPQMTSLAYIYKKEMNLAVNPTWQDCYTFVDEIVSNEINSAYKVQGFTTKNLWYYDANNDNMVKNLC